MSAISLKDAKGRAAIETTFENALEIASGFSSTSACVAELMVVTIPSPTRATMVSSVAPPPRDRGCANGDTGFEQLNSVTGDGINGGARHLARWDVDHFGVNRCTHGVENIATRQVNGTGTLMVSSILALLAATSDSLHGQRGH